jgi:hypothetical protein
MRISTRSGPNSAIRGASRDAHDGSGDSRVPRKASVRMLSLSSGFVLKASCRVAIFGNVSGCNLISQTIDLYQLLLRLPDV